MPILIIGRFPAIGSENQHADTPRRQHALVQATSKLLRIVGGGRRRCCANTRQLTVRHRVSELSLCPGEAS